MIDGVAYTSLLLCGKKLVKQRAYLGYTDDVEWRIEGYGAIVYPASKYFYLNDAKVRDFVPDNAVELFFDAFSSVMICRKYQ